MPKEKIEVDEKEVKVKNLKLKNISIDDFINTKYKKIFKENDCLPIMFMLHDGGNKLPIIFSQSPKDTKSKQIVVQILSDDEETINKVKKMFTQEGS